jgi:hypothetical protein
MTLYPGAMSIDHGTSTLWKLVSKLCQVVKDLSVIRSRSR